jgi:hypothetical protein
LAAAAAAAAVAMNEHFSLSVRPFSHSFFLLLFPPKRDTVALLLFSFCCQYRKTMNDLM